MGRKWMNIREKKAKTDQNTSRIYAKFGIEIYAAAKSGDPDPESNQKLKFVVDRAKTYNVPRHVIEKAIDKTKASVQIINIFRFKPLIIILSSFLLLLKSSNNPKIL